MWHYLEIEIGKIYGGIFHMKLILEFLSSFSSDHETDPEGFHSGFSHAYQFCISFHWTVLCVLHKMVGEPDLIDASQLVAMFGTGKITYHFIRMRI